MKGGAIVRGTNRMRSLLISGAVVILALAVVAGMTWALFTDTITIQHHLKAGDLDITLERTKLVTTYLDNSDGFLKPHTNTNLVNFSKPGQTGYGENVFDITGDTLVVPGSKYVADMKITNNSDVAFLYWVEVVYKIVDADGNVIENPTKDINEELGKQIEVKIDTETKPDKIAELKTSPFVGSEEDPIGILEKKDAAENNHYTEKFTVSIEFVDDYVYTQYENNDAMDLQVKFDIVVHAVQVQQDPNA
jgi:predicted ribosomally synthesized peptide with SipW-like signal peptide